MHRFVRQDPGVFGQAPGLVGHEQGIFVLGHTGQAAGHYIVVALVGGEVRAQQHSTGYDLAIAQGGSG